jgi:hypothetical protein
MGKTDGRADPCNRPAEYWHGHREEYFDLAPVEQVSIARQYQGDTVLQGYLREARERDGMTQGPAVFAEFTPFEQCEILPPFPLGTLPPATREFVHAAAETAQAPVDMVGACVLGALEIACRGRYPVRLSNGHIERPCLYVAPVAPPSERKSSVIDVVVRPLIAYETEYNQRHGGEVEQSRSELRLLQGRIANAEQRAIKAKNGDEQLSAEYELQELNNELAEFETVEPLRLYGADVTPEKLAAMLKSQGAVFALVSAEGGGLFENIGRYSEKGGLEIYLNGYSGDRICVDRKNSESIVIDRPTLTMMAPCQPSVVADLFSDRQKTGRGLLSRILFVKCPSRVGGRRATAKPLDERTRTNYHNLCRAMLAAAEGGNLAYDNEGFAVYAAFFDEIEPQLTPDTGELSFMADWAGKLHGQMTRFAGLIHCVNAFEQGRSPLDTMIDAEEAQAAAELARYCLAHAKAVYNEQAEPESVTNARYLWGRIKSLNSLSFSKSELTRKVQNKGAFDYAETLQRLIENGYIRIEQSVTGRGRPSETVIVNPEAVKESEKSEINHEQSNKFTLFTQNAINTMPANVPNVPAGDCGLEEIPF